MSAHRYRRGLFPCVWYGVVCHTKEEAKKAQRAYMERLESRRTYPCKAYGVECANKEFYISAKNAYCRNRRRLIRESSKPCTVVRIIQKIGVPKMWPACYKIACQL